MAIIVPSLAEKCKGALISLAIGDALGWPYEKRSKNKSRNLIPQDNFVDWIRRCNWPAYHDEHIMAGEYSDDTQMVLSIARSIILGKWEKHFTEKELPFWLSYQRGGGSALIKAARHYSKGNVPLWQSSHALEYYNAGGNGAAMRIIPHVIAACNKGNHQALMYDVARDTFLTHGHPRAILGALCYAYALYILMNQDTTLEYGELITTLIDQSEEWCDISAIQVPKSQTNPVIQCPYYDYIGVWNATKDNMLKQLNYISSQIKNGLMVDDTQVITTLGGYGRENGAGDIACLISVYYASRYADNPTLAIKTPACSSGLDTDTIASMTGALVGMLNGTSWIPVEWMYVQDRKCLEQISELLLSKNRIKTAKEELLDTTSSGNNWQTTPIGKVCYIETKEMNNGTRGVVRIHKWRTALGQTFYTKEYSTYATQGKREKNDTDQTLTDYLCDSNNTVHANQNVPTSITTEEGSISSPKERISQNRFVLDISSSTALLENPVFKKNITAGKLLKVISAILVDGNSTVHIAHRFGIDEAMIELIKSQIQKS